jgi:hypothetical protein
VSDALVPELDDVAASVELNPDAGIGMMPPTRLRYNLLRCLLIAHEVEVHLEIRGSRRLSKRQAHRPVRGVRVEFLFVGTAMGGQPGKARAAMGLGVEMGLVSVAGAGEDAEKAGGDECVDQIPQEASGIIVERTAPQNESDRASGIEGRRH